MTVQELLDEALALHNAQKTAEAGERYRRILALDPGHPSALHLLGVIALQEKRLDDAIGLIGRAIAARPDNAAYHANLGNAYLAQDKLAEAVESYRKAIALDAKFVNAQANLGAVLRMRGEFAEAKGVLERALELAPGNAVVLNNLANVVDSLGDRVRAIELYRRALSIDERYPEACRNLGRALFQEKAYDEAITWLRRAIAAEPDNPAPYVHLGLSLHELGAFGEALFNLARAVEIEPDNAEYLNNYGIMLSECGRFEEAREQYRLAGLANPASGDADCNYGVLLLKTGRAEEALQAFGRALEKNPDTVGACNGKGVAYASLGRFAEGVPCLEEELRRHPDNSEAHMNLGMTLLVPGRYEEAWPHYEYRAERKGFASASGPKWHGEDLGSDTLLVYPEQGAGDNIHFLRYLPLLRNRYPKARIVYPSPEALKRLFAHTLEQAGIEVFASSDDVHTHGFQSALLSIPGLMETTLATVPADVPYLEVEPSWAEPWAPRLAGIARPRVGLAWAGNPDYPGDRDRSIPFEMLSGLLEVSGATFVSLQKAAKAQPPARHPRLLDWMDQVTDFADTAALIDQLDLVISVDTSVAHLAGALGRPVWLLNRTNTDWRWLLEREDSPWYPTMRIFRQSKRGDWSDVLRKVEEALAGWVAARDSVRRDEKPDRESNPPHGGGG